MAIPKTIEQLTAPETGYWLSPDQERYYGGPIDSREAALAQARTNGYAYIARCTKSHIRLALEFDAGDWLIAVEETNEELQDEECDTILDFGQDKVDDLQATVRAAIDAWQVKHQLRPSPWRFESVEAVEAVEAVAKCATGGAVSGPGPYPLMGEIPPQHTITRGIE